MPETANLLQAGRGHGKTTYAIDVARDLVAMGERVAFVVPSPQRADWLRRLLREAGVDVGWTTHAGPVVVLTLKALEEGRLRGMRRRVIAEDVDQWPDGVYTEALWSEDVALFTSSPHPLDELTRQRYTANEFERLRRAAAARDASERAETERLLLAMWLLFKLRNYELPWWCPTCGEHNEIGGPGEGLLPPVDHVCPSRPSPELRGILPTDGLIDS